MTQPFDLVVAGGGIAGLTAALTAARLGRRTLALTGDVLGGQLLSINRIDGFPGFPEGIAGYDLCPMTQEQAAAAGAEFAATTLDGIAPDDGGWQIACGDGEARVARAVIVATGAELKPLAVPGADRLAGKGVSHCASCDAPLLKGKVAVVVGGGDSAAQEALTLAESAVRVILIHRGPALAAQAAYRDRIRAETRIELRPDTEVVEVLGEAHVTGVRVRDRAGGATADVEASGVFAYIGLAPNAAPFAARLALDPDGRIPTDVRMRTALPGICAAGAVRGGWPGRAAASAGEGAAAAIAIDRYLEDGTWRNS
ncbi:MAG TPA: FAD-dependent oxidoreductase [Stellaceae bacterium]|nr:FAD-dependent oxidoreductase [Stellaceae bacterium]